MGRHVCRVTSVGKDEQVETDTPGTMLAGQRLSTALEKGRIFAPGSWKEARIKGAGYTIGLAGDWVAAPGSGGTSIVVRPGGESKPVSSVTLRVGEAAVVASEEKFCLDFNISCTIGPMFRWAAEGLQLLHGAAAHPGYGRVQSPDDEEWVADEDMRLYFVVVNIGVEPITLKVGKPIAYLQFFNVEEARREHVENVAFSKLTERFIDGHGKPEYYKSVLALGEKVRASDERLKVVETLVERSSKVLELVVVFGVFLVTATLLGVVYGGLADAITGLPANPEATQVGMLQAVSLAFGGTVLAAFFIFAKTLSRWQGGKGDE